MLNKETNMFPPDPVLADHAAVIGLIYISWTDRWKTKTDLNWSHMNLRQTDVRQKPRRNICVGH